MSLSFEASLASAQLQGTQPMSLETAPMILSMDEPMTADELEGEIPAYDGWMKPANADFYKYYDNEYFDEKISTISADKNIKLDSGQVNVTQESNSQYIPFELDRFVDGFDLTTTKLKIYWVNPYGDGMPETLPVDVYYNSEKIKFAWLVDNIVTKYAGNIKFEIHAEGENSKGESYVWKTYPCSGINIQQALQIQQYIQPDSEWQESFAQRVENAAATAQMAAVQAEKAQANAEQAASAAADEAAAKAVENIKPEIAEMVEQEVNEVMLENYYTKAEVDALIESAVRSALSLTLL